MFSFSSKHKCVSCVIISKESKSIQGIEKHPRNQKADIKVKYGTAGVRGLGIRNKSALISSGVLYHCNINDLDDREEQR